MPGNIVFDLLIILGSGLAAAVICRAARISILIGYCAGLPNPEQNDQDNDGLGDVCDSDRDGDTQPDDSDNCPLVANQDQLDSDGDGTGDACDTGQDDDGDGVDDGNDLCVGVPDPEQIDLDSDGVGDVCDNDDDGDGTLILIRASKIMETSETSIS